MRRKMLSIIAALAVALCMIPAAAFADTGYTEVENQNDLQNMTSDTEYKVTADFSVDATTFTPVTNFTGTLDGDGHTITWTGTSASSAKSLTENYFGLVKTNSGTIKNLTTAGSLYVSGSSNDYVGAAAGYNAGTIDKVQNSTVVSAAGFYNVGGIAGFNTGTISLSRNIGSIKATKKVGGITGENTGTIEKCYNAANVMGTDASKNGVGGIAGRLGNNNTSAGTSIIRNCFNRGDITCIDGKWAGGICGFESSASTCENCYNAGNIIGESYLDHIAGKREGTVTNCYGLNGVSGPEKHDGADLLAPNQLEGYATIKDSKYIIELLNGSDSIWEQTTGEFPYIIGNTMSSVYSFTFTGPTKTAYRAGENFSTDGLVITATPTAGEAKTVPASAYTIIDGNNLSASKESVTASGTYSGVDFSLEIPITVTGYDTVNVGTGCTCTDLDSAFRLVNKNGTIQVMNKLTISAASDLTYNKAVTIKRGAAFTGEMFEIAAGSHMVTFTTMTIDGGYGTPTANADTLFKVTSGTLRLRGNVTLNNCNVAVDVAAGSGNTANLVVNRAKIIGSTNSIKLENTSSNFTFENYSGGTSSSITGKVYLATGTYITVAAAFPCNITLDLQNAEVGAIVARGTSGYTLKTEDVDKVTCTEHKFRLDTTNNCISVKS